MSESVLAFGPFQLFPSQRLILESGKPLRLGSRALDILIALSARPGEIFSKEELIAHVWPDIFVEETNLRVHIAALRKALREDRSVSRFIDNIPGRGYCFVAPVAKQAVSPQEGAPQPSAQRVYHLPKPVGRLIGRDDIVGLLTEQLSQRRFVTIVGPGGIGKTTGALAVAEALVSSYPDGVAFLDLATLEDPLLLPGALAAALGHTIRSAGKAR
jgi:DNA-binding winged helix-turn-helix (wHTH) protein